MKDWTPRRYWAWIGAAALTSAALAAAQMVLPPLLFALLALCAMSFLFRPLFTWLNR